MPATTEMDQAFVEYVVKSIVDNPAAVEVTRTVDERGVLLELKVDPEDMGKIIGKAGATAKALRTLLRVLGAKGDARFNLKIVEPEGGSGEGSEPRQHNEVYDEVENADQSSQPDEDDDHSAAIKAKAREGLEGLDDLNI